MSVTLAIIVVVSHNPDLLLQTTMHMVSLPIVKPEICIVLFDLLRTIRACEPFLPGQASYIVSTAPAICSVSMFLNKESLPNLIFTISTLGVGVPKFGMTVT